jgi:hypothetical protein
MLRWRWRWTSNTGRKASVKKGGIQGGCRGASDSKIHTTHRSDGCGVRVGTWKQLVHGRRVGLVQGLGTVREGGGKATSEGTLRLSRQTRKHRPPVYRTLAQRDVGTQTCCSNSRGLRATTVAWVRKNWNMTRRDTRTDGSTPVTCSEEMATKADRKSSAKPRGADHTCREPRAHTREWMETRCTPPALKQLQPAWG